MIKHGSLKTVTFTLVTGDTVEVADTALNAPMYGSAAIDAFLKGEKIIRAGEKCWLNACGIITACVESVPTSAEYEDDNCVVTEEESA